MIIDKVELHRLYMEWVNQVAEDCDWKTHFGTEEIVHAIVHILETNPQIRKTGRKPENLDAVYQEVWMDGYDEGLYDGLYK
jgi:hypothetical protein